MLVHELPRNLARERIESALRDRLSGALIVLFLPQTSFETSSPRHSSLTLADQRFLIRPQGSYKQIVEAPTEAAAFRKELGLGATDKLVLGVGYADLRKGFDLFLHAWSLVQQKCSNVHFCWAGGIDPGLLEWLGTEIKRAEATGQFHLSGFRSDMQVLYSASSVYALTSREDPFPTVGARSP